MASRNMVAIGASAGGVEALRSLAARLPEGFPASVLIVIHLPKGYRSSLDAILSAAGAMRATFAEDDEVLEAGRIYIAPPDRHLLADGERLRLGLGPRENHVRPAIDPLFRSVALCCGARAIGVVLTGTLSDGASGLHALKQAGGIAVVQDPRDAAFPDMPEAALSRVEPDYAAALANLPALLSELVGKPAGEPGRVPERVKYEVEIAMGRRSNIDEMDGMGRRSTFTCPDCQGVMWELKEGDLTRYRCHVGHAYTAELMDVMLDESVGHALATALRALEERAALARKLGEESLEQGRSQLADMWTQRVREYETEADVLRQSIRRVQRIAQSRTATSSM